LILDFEIVEDKIKDIKADIEIIFVVEKNFSHKWVEDEELLKSLGFKGESEEVCLLADRRKLYVGLDSFDKDEVRLAISKALNSIKKTEFKTLKIGSYVDACPVSYIKGLVEGAILGSYEFDMYKSKKNPKKEKTLIISLEDAREIPLDINHAKKSMQEAKIIAEVTNNAKTIVNQAPDDMTPVKLAEYAQDLASRLEDVECFIGDEEFLKEQKMGAFLAVSRASSHPPRFIHLTYKPKDAKEKFVFVGKGLTYDSGGLSLKPSDFMVTMKSDKSGSASVISVLEGVARLKLPFEVHVIVGACENMIGGNAYKPDDILVAKNGKTIEIRNTDAEGRLVLADCLCYASELKPDYLVDMATLTGACVVAVGEYTTGIMGHNSKLKHEVLKVSKHSGELFSSLQFNRYLKKLLKSSVADISNIASSRYGGAITAGLFLDNFVSEDMKDKWMHWDIAGPAYVEKAWGYNQAGASGAGVRQALYWMSAKTYRKKH
jgi:leucyl aminopeptidase